MSRPDLSRSARGLRAGDVVEVRSEAEILATLNGDGTLDGLPLMPEMLRSCGQRFTVENRSDTTCFWSGLRDMDAAVHLTAVRCDGSAHGGCQANCLIFWKEEWLRPVEGAVPGRPAPAAREPVRRAGASRADLERATHQPGSPVGGPDELWSCQHTQVREATRRIPAWDVRHFVRDIRNGTVTAPTVLRYLVPYLVEKFQGVSRAKLPKWLLIAGGEVIPPVRGRRNKTPVKRLDLQPGEQVRVRSRQEIRQTVDRNARNRGLTFETEMTPYCGRSMTVGRRVTQIIDEWTGRMLHLSSDCIVLEGAVCRGLYHGMCTRRTDAYWREIWLERETASEQAQQKKVAE